MTGFSKELGFILLGKNTSQKQKKTGKIHSVPVLPACKCRSENDRLEEMLRKAGLYISVQWPEESLEFRYGIGESCEDGI